MRLAIFQKAQAARNMKLEQFQMIIETMKKVQVYEQLITDFLAKQQSII